MIHHCEAALPYEACGFLTGLNGMGGRAWPISNLETNFHSFEMKQEEVVNLSNRLGDGDEQITAIYHSHPTSIAYPSPMDILFAPDGDIAYIIVSFLYSYPQVKCFYIHNKKVNQLSLQIIDH